MIILLLVDCFAKTFSISIKYVGLFPTQIRSRSSSLVALPDPRVRQDSLDCRALCRVLLDHAVDKRLHLISHPRKPLIICGVFVFDQNALRLPLRSRAGGQLVSKLAELPDVAAEVMRLASFDFRCNECDLTARHVLDDLSLRLDGEDAV